MTTKERAYLKGLAANLEPVFQIGKAGLTPEVTEAVRETFNTRELVKLAVLKLYGGSQTDCRVYSRPYRLLSSAGDRQENRTL